MIRPNMSRLSKTLILMKMKSAEEYIKGREFSVVVDGKAYPIIENAFRDRRL